MNDDPASATIATIANVPRATARLQLNGGFRLGDAAAQVDYYAALGVSHLYLSPVFRACPGSTHGYDVTDFGLVNPELGGEPAFVDLATRARAAGLGLILDIVPNHMAASATHNPWWRDVLANGRHSAYADYFDIDWEPPDRSLHGKVLLPVLAESYWDALRNNKLRWRVDNLGLPELRYGDLSLPLAAGSADANAAPGHFDAALPAGRNRMHALLERQHYRLAWWRTAATALNWRRFFEISDLIGLREERPQVFEAVHALVFRLFREGWIDGVRVDHVDGLADPAGYCRQLRARLDALCEARPTRARLAGRPWIVVEKILAEHETLPGGWQVDGTTGYDFLDDIGAVLHDTEGEAALTALWQRTCGAGAPCVTYAGCAQSARRRMLTRHLVAEYDAACAALHALARGDPALRDLTRATLRHALGSLLAALPVYRTYFSGQAEPRDAGAERAMLCATVAHLRRALAPDEVAALEAIAGWLQDGSIARTARTRSEQLMPALAAKGGEDTAFYRYGRLLSRNEVGSHPGTFATTPRHFHARMAARRHAWPHAMLATATHDHKRGEDARMRLAVLSELPEDWNSAVASWERRCAPWLAARALDVPDAVDRLMLYQTLVGAWPPEASPLADELARARFLGRISAWQHKAIREAKRHGNWTHHDTAYESACDAFLRSLGDKDAEGDSVLARIGAFAAHIAAAGIVNSLAQVLVQLTAPGVPDRYQGREGWDFSLVDPDNRAVPDYAGLRARLGCAAGWPHWLAHWQDGRVKQQLIRAVLAQRRAHAALFTDGAYRPMEATGTLAAHVLAFARTLEGDVCIAVATRLAARLADPVLPRIPTQCWDDTALHVGALMETGADGPWTDVLTGHVVTASQGWLRLHDVLAVLPVALLRRG